MTEKLSNLPRNPVGMLVVKRVPRTVQEAGIAWRIHHLRSDFACVLAEVPANVLLPAEQHSPAIEQIQGFLGSRGVLLLAEGELFAGARTF